MVTAQWVSSMNNSPPCNIFSNPTFWWLSVSRTGVYNSINGSATPADSQYAEFIVNFDSVPGRLRTTKLAQLKWSIAVQNSRPNYRELATDYLNYAIVYDCLDIFGLFKAESLWFLTRSQLPDAKLVDEGYRLQFLENICCYWSVFPD